MEKLVYVVWKVPEVSPQEFREAMLEKLAPALQRHGARKLEMNLVDEHVADKPRMALTDPPVAGIVSLWLDCVEDREPLEALLATHVSRLAGYLVTESVPQPNTEHPPEPGQRTWGVNMVALIEKPERLGYDEWIEHWHGHHKRVALEVQSTFFYVRNAVVRALTSDAPPWLGIVEEAFPMEAVGNPAVWYDAGDSQEKLRANMARMIESVQAFLDMDRVESHPMSHYLLPD